MKTEIDRLRIIPDKYLTAILCRDAELDQWDNSRYQAVIPLLDWVWIKKVYIPPREILLEKNRDYFYTVMDYEDVTTHFNELVSLN